jgi:hypothetical protein
MPSNLYASAYAAIRKGVGGCGGGGLVEWASRARRDVGSGEMLDESGLGEGHRWPCDSDTYSI